MRGPGPDRGPSTAFEWIFSAVLLGGIVLVFFVIIFQDFQPVKLFPLFFVISWLILLPWHEAGHAVVAYLLGWYVGHVVIGMGRPLRRFRFGSALVELRMFPIEGFVRCVPKNLHWPRLKSALIYFAGPGAELLLLLAMALLIGPGTLLSYSDHVGLIACQALATAILASVFFNLIPHAVPTANGNMANDGLGILRSFWMPRSYFAAMIRRMEGEGSRMEDRG